MLHMAPRFGAGLLSIVGIFTYNMFLIEIGFGPRTVFKPVIGIVLVENGCVLLKRESQKYFIRFIRCRLSTGAVVSCWERHARGYVRRIWPRWLHLRLSGRGLSSRQSRTGHACERWLCVERRAGGSGDVL
jgi:hypothetical protein